MMVAAGLGLVLQRLPELWLRTGEHLYLAGTATAIAVVVGIPLGVICHRVRSVRGPLLGILSILQTIPSLAMLAFLLALLSRIGALPAIVALTLYAFLPIVRNTFTGLGGVAPEVTEAARGVGMTPGQRLAMVELPLAVPVILAGIRTAAVISVGIATLSAFIGAGGLGEFVIRGLSMNNIPLVLLGAVPAAILALLVNFAIGAAEWGLRPTRQSEKGAWKPKLKPLALASPAMLIAFGVVTSLVELSPTAPRPGDGSATAGSIRIGSKEFTEQYILGELMAQMIEARTSLAVERTFGLGGTMICHRALEKGEIDLYPEYSGTGYQAVLKLKGSTDPNEVLRLVTEGYRKQYQVDWLGPFGFNNSYAITVRAEDAEENGWRRISDLASSASQLRAGFTSEFQEREDGYPGLQKAYGFRFAEARDLSPALMYEAAAKKQVDVICAFATDGRIAAYRLRPLLDDRKFFPPYHAAPVVRQETLRKHPEVREALAPLAGLLDDATMQRLNYEVDEKKRSPAEVASEFLKAKGLIGRREADTRTVKGSRSIRLGKIGRG